MSLNEWLAIGMIGAFFVMLLIGIPVAISIATTAFVFGFIGFGPMLFNLLPSRIYGVVTNYTFMAIPLFVFMGVMLEKSKLAAELIDVVGHLFGNVSGGMGVAIIFVGVLLGAATGIVGATIVTLGLLTLPTLLRRGYPKALASGMICASGTLGQIIPPSLVLILLAEILGESVGTMFAAAMMPGLTLAAVYIIAILALAAWKPHLMPPIPAEERAQMGKAQLLRKVILVVGPPVGLVVAVLGSIIGGIAAPTEAAAMGALGALVFVASSGRLSLDLLTEVAKATLIISSMVFFILISAQVFGLAFRGLGGEHLVARMFEWVPGGEIGALLFMLLLMFVLGFFLEWIEISYIALPLFLPFFIQMGVDMVWLGILVGLVLQTSFLTPPFGWSLFFLKGVAPKGVTTLDIYLGVLPFIALQFLAIAMVILFPGIATWLPAAIGW
ncbi:MULTISPECIES: TRAP transporter large permease [Halomonadaceae]|jgi:tripartite ATP-independent transporter DctM subunit|uniref:TRAP transporter large permease protein n=1 Tax=Vreelandella janggokensis TaxID=370767 RepID=A0ABT4ITR2_9GAMM|nr:MULTISPECIES: TRAP transporter large permease subunit [Halomonas]MCW4148572.1 TRAP transporter large permease subunit [Halomonas sp. 18H]MCZ0927036.1 TRAP transporter large permease subunit [Halomonas janggokensis]MCZ0930209.1 TRAP transporter large permease subunit [Halomonas janggokensis]MDR5884938.1 TRAP transporter large permease subunit [Halomonas janggokensis]QPL45049.1 TRAP transporter large permease subunit [Halomonas sp. A40-4]